MSVLTHFSQTIGIFSEVLSKDFCESLISYFEETSTHKQAGETTGGINTNIKNTLDTLLPETFTKKIGNVSNECIDKYVEKFGYVNKWNPAVMWGDGTHYPFWQMQKYFKNEGHYNAFHTEENYKKRTSNRLFVVMFYINDVKEGGRTLFPYSNLNIEPTRGTFLCWPAGWPWLHAGEMPKSNDKYIVTSWLCANWGAEQ
jgi:hypothetical protein